MIHNITLKTWFSLLTFSTLLVIVGCTTRSLFSTEGPFGFTVGDPPPETAVVTDPGIPVTEQPPICDPFGNTPGTGANSGLIAKLTYVPVDLATYNMTMDQFIPGAPNVSEVANQVFLSQINKPSTRFESGFQDKNGNYLKANDGSNLIEFFALFISGQIKLQDSDPEGEYEFAILSDDGALLYFDQSASGNWVKYAGIDGTHADQLGCGSSTISLKHGKSVPIQEGYFQAPRYYITNQLYWRNTHIGEAEPFCGGGVYDSVAFAARGWSVVPAANFVLPSNVPTNPCNT